MTHTTCQEVFDAQEWMVPDTGIAPPQVLFFRNVFKCESGTFLHFAFSADEFADVYLDGERIAEGPERCTIQHWHYGTVKKAIEPGEHVLVFRLLTLGPLRPMAQLTVAHGLWVRECTSLLGSWEWAVQEGTSYFQPQPDFGSSPKVAVGTGYVSTRFSGGGDRWRPVALRRDTRKLYPPSLPVLRYDPEPVTEDGKLLRFNTYFIGFGEYTFRGVGMVRIRWFENPEPDFATDNRWAGIYEDIIQVNGEVKWRDIWWRAGQCVSIDAGANVKVEYSFHRTGYPWQWKVDFHSADADRQLLLDTARRTLECCTRDTFMDCPYYEQMQYVADSRIEMLSAYQVSDDRHLTEKVIRQLADGQNARGALRCRYPDWLTDKQDDPNGFNLILPGFELIYIQMVHDYARERRNDDLIRSVLPTMRAIRKRMASLRSADGILRDLPGWNFLDWHPDWSHGCPPGCANGSGCTLNWLYLRSLKDLADIEKHFGEMAEHDALLQEAAMVEDAIVKKFWVEEQGLYAETEERSYFSEHAQVFAALAANRTESLHRLEDGTLDQCGIYFSFYFLEVCRIYGLKDAFEKRIAKYLEVAKMPGVTTFPENFAHWRSWCHAWSANFLYFFYVKPGDNITNPIPD
jgi:hypothetical protein